MVGRPCLSDAVFDGDESFTGDPLTLSSLASVSKPICICQLPILPAPLAARPAVWGGSDVNEMPCTSTTGNQSRC
jgi:hypothetical protein